MNNLAASIAQLEQEIAWLDHEMAYILSPEGEVLAKVPGDETMVELACVTDLLPGNTLLHNHPLSGLVPEPTFSAQDIRCALFFHIPHMVVATREYRYEMFLPEGKATIPNILVAEFVLQRAQSFFQSGRFDYNDAHHWALDRLGIPYRVTERTIPRETHYRLAAKWGDSGEVRLQPPYRDGTQADRREVEPFAARVGTLA